MSQFPITIIKWKRVKNGAFNAILDDVDGVIKAYAATSSEIEIDISNPRQDDLKEELRASILGNGDTTNSLMGQVFLILGDVLIRLLGMLLKEDDFSKVLTENQILIVTTIGTSSEIVSPNVVHGWAPSANIISRYAAQQIYKDKYTKVVVKEMLPAIMESGLFGSAQKIFGDYFQALGGTVERNDNGASVVYLTGFGNDVINYLDKHTNKVIYADHGCFSSLIERRGQGGNLRSVVPQNVRYFDYDAHDGDKHESNYAIFVREMLRFISNLINRIERQARYKLSLLDAVSGVKYHETEFGDIFLLSDMGRFIVPLSYFNGGKAKPVTPDVTQRIGQEKIASALDVAEEILHDFKSESIIDYSLSNRIFKEKLNFLCWQAFQTFNVEVAAFIVCHPHVEVKNELFVSWSVHEDTNKCRKFERGDISRDIMEDVLLKASDVVQINIGGDETVIDDYEDNDAFRLFAVLHQENKVLLPIHILPQEKLSVAKAFILAKTEYMARYALNTNKSVNAAIIINQGQIVERIKRFIQNLYTKWKQNGAVKFIYLFPNRSGGDNKNIFGCSVMISNSKLDYLVLQSLRTIIGRIFIFTFYGLSLRDTRIANVKSAIGSIMSRNGSHNIGSHVLAALSHNVGTMPDDRVLYQYIQHRMDYIATATTEFPIWKQPILFVGNLMRTFFSQRHLLDYIVGSEGLHGYKFQDKNLTVGDAQKNTVRIHVRKRKDSPGQQNGRYEGKIGDKGFVEFVSYENPECAGRNIPLNEDVELAIPGGIVGQHAFYTIIENVLRNAAKHDWAHFDKGQKAVEKWLDVYIDFWDCAEEGKVEFLIWCEQAILGYGADCANATLLSGKNLEARVKRVSDGDENALRGLSLIQKLQVRVNAPFIDRSGKLRSENWGLAEMRISAGYLQGRDIAEIGGIGKKDGEPDVVSPAIVHVKEDKERERFKGRYCLGYRFYVEKPKELLVIVPAAAEIPKGATVLVQHGIYFDKYSKDLAKKSLPYAYVITSGLNDEEYKTWALPFRTLSNDKYKAECKSAVRKRHVGLENWIPYFDAYDKVLRIANEVTKKSAKNKAQEIMDLVYTAWTKFVIEKRLKDNGKPTPKVLLSILAQENGSHAAGKGLVTTLDLLNMVFEHCFNTSIRAYAKISESLDPEQAEILSLLLNIRKKASLTPQGLQEQNIDVDDSSKIICWQMLKWIESTTEVDSYLAKWERNEVELISAGSAAPQNDSGVMRHFTVADIKQIVLMFKDYLNCRLGNLRPAVAATTVRERRKAREANAHPMSGMASFFAYLRDSALEQARVFLTKYEEDIVTLPKGYDVDDKHSSNVKCDQWYFSGDERGAWDVEVSYCGNTRASDGTAHVQTVEYKRHFDSQKEHKRVGAKNFPNLLYIEALSGTQAYLNSLVQMTRCPKGLLDKRMVSMLLEVGLMRIVIIDERVAKFASDHCDVRVAFENMGIEVKNEESPFVKALISDDGKDISKLKEKREEREILIVHQGIIDKLLKTHDSLSVANLINRIVESGLFRYVVITTGRGTPANLPEQARVLPFSTVEGALFKKYPEKFSLVNAVMNILPVKKEANV